MCESLVMDDVDILLDIKDLRVSFGSEKSPVRAVDGVSFSIPRGTTMAIVGESGCGKSVTALSLARLVPEPQGRYVSGSILLEGEDVLKMNRKRLLALRGRDIAYIFQEPGTALNPVYRVGSQIEEAVRLHQRDVDVREEVVKLMNMVGLPEPEKRMRAYPHEMSGGMQQRVMIAMALACSPKLLVADEPTTALDVTIQAQILELLVSLQSRMNMTVLIITHNLGLVADIAHVVNVMYSGRIVESGRVEDVLAHPGHPYTKGLLDAVPRIDFGSQNGNEVRLQGIDGFVPNPSNLPEGCKFAPRCLRAHDKCRIVEPELLFAGNHPEDGGTGFIAGKDRMIRCYFPLGTDQ